MLDLTIPVIALNIGLPAFQVYRTVKKGGMKHRNLRLVFDIFFAEATMVYDGIRWIHSKKHPKKA